MENLVPATMSPMPRLSASQANLNHAKRIVRIGAWVIIGGIIPVGLWMGLAQLSMAVVAPAVVTVDMHRRPVQHLEGGIVRAVLVRDGQKVKAGETILILGDVGVEADRNRLRYRVNTERAALARFDAEQALAKALVFPEELIVAARQDERVKEALLKETALFNARRDSLVSEVALMRAQRERVQQEIAALNAQIAQGVRSLEWQEKDLEVHRSLIKDSYIAPVQVWQKEAGLLDYAAKLDERRSELARAHQRLIEGELKIKSVQNEYVRLASDQLKATAARLGEIEQEMRKSDDAAVRQVVKAPADGEIMDLKITSPGAVVRPGEPIAEIVPSDGALMVEARIRPEEVNHVQRGQRTKVKFTAHKYKNAEMANGKVTYVSADRFNDRMTGQPYYSVLIQIDEGSLKIAGDIKLQAGMPAEVYIEGSKQTPLQYLIDPITSTMRKAGREL